jgi:heme/copper-type cytochrome/quinol oxidase subunit 2
MPLSARQALFWSSAVCCLLAQVLIVRSVLAVRRLPEPRPELVRSRDGVELFWALLPAVALGVLFYFTWRAIEQRTSFEQTTAPAVEATTSLEQTRAPVVEATTSPEPTPRTPTMEATR